MKNSSNKDFCPYKINKIRSILQFNLEHVFPETLVISSKKATLRLTAHVDKENILK